MERLDLGDSTLPIRIFGQDIDLRKPSIAEVFDNESKIKSAENDSKKLIDVMEKFITSLGMPDDVAKKMSLEHYEKLMNHLSGSKKN